MTVACLIAQAHATAGPDRAFRPGDVVSLRPEHVMTHDNTAAVLKKFGAIGLERIRYPGQPVWPMDHDVQNRSEANLRKYATIESFAREQDVDFYPPGTGISHQIMLAEGYVQPGSLVVASDSHANMYGAVGALGTPVVRTDAAAIWATGEFWWQIPESVQVVLHGRLQPGVTGKDVILTLCVLYNQGEVLNTAIEFSGDGVGGLTMDDRFTIANMTTEWGALSGWFPVDETTIDWFEERLGILSSRGVHRFNPSDLRRWASNPIAPHADAPYAARIDLDLSEVTPHVSGPDSVQVSTSLAALEPQRIPVHKAYLLSCVNSRLSDIEAAARVLKGRRVADGVELYVAAASREIQDQARESGAWQSLVEAGAKTLPPGCGPCIGLGEGLLESGETGISATNRNFKGRMGSRDAQAFLASPAVVAASAAAGYISAPAPCLDGLPEYQLHRFKKKTGVEAVDIIPGFPRELNGRTVFLPQDNLNTDGIYGKDFTYREDVTPDEMAAVVLRNYDPGLAAQLLPGDILVGGYNFGTGSSREQAATALKAAGIRMVIAGSFSQTYLRNAFNNGFICIACPELVDHLVSRLDRDPETPYIIDPAGLRVMFDTGTVVTPSHTFSFRPLGEVPQALVVAGGVEPMIREQLGLGTPAHA